MQPWLHFPHALPYRTRLLKGGAYNATVSSMTKRLEITPHGVPVVLTQQFRDDFGTFDTRETLIETLEFDGETFVVNAQTL